MRSRRASVWRSTAGLGLALEHGDAAGEVGGVVGQLAQAALGVAQGLAVVRVRVSPEGGVLIDSGRERGEVVAHLVGAFGESA